MLKTQIKASQITNLTDARYFSAWGVDWMGFEMEEGSDLFIPPANLKVIKEWIEGPEIIGEYNLQGAANILADIEQLGLDGIQVGPFYSVKELAKLTEQLIIQKIVIDEQTTFENVNTYFRERDRYVNLFILDFASNGISWEDLKKPGAAISDQLIGKCAKHYSLLLDIPFDAAANEELLDLGIMGFAVRGGEEEKVGFKSFEDLDDLFEAIEED